jgi:rSAM/selenodomain-associated transferase 2
VKLAVVVPVLNEGAGIGATLSGLQAMRARGVRIVVVDGGSSDDTAGQARACADDVISSTRGRARQMNAGARHIGTAADALLFLHADTRLPPEADAAVIAALRAGARWGRFDVRIDGTAPLLTLVGGLMNWRSRLTGICTGDQAIFVERGLFEALGGWPDQPLMEDIEFSRRARRVAAPAALRQTVVTSGRRWEQGGVWRTITLMWSMRWRYFRGVDPAELAREYRDARETPDSREARDAGAGQEAVASRSARPRRDGH